jgi:hypothetical protein
VQVTLKDVANLASWNTPSARDHKDTPGMATTGINPDGTTRERIDMLPRQAMHLAAWVSPTTDAKRGGLPPRPQDTGVPLTQQVPLSSWPTPMAGTKATATYNEAGSTDSSRQTTYLCGKDIRGSGITEHPTWPLVGPARLTAFGTLLTGYSAETASGDQLNPDHSRWLMACPEAWAQVAPNYDDWQRWQDLMRSLSPEQKSIALGRSQPTATPSTSSRPPNSAGLPLPPY